MEKQEISGNYKTESNVSQKKQEQNTYVSFTGTEHGSNRKCKHLEWNFRIPRDF